MRIIKTVIAALLVMSILITSYPIAFAKEDEAAADSKSAAENVESDIKTNGNFSICNVSNESGENNKLRMTFNYLVHVDENATEYIFAYPVDSAKDINNNTPKVKVSGFSAVNPISLKGVKYAYQYDFSFQYDLPEHGIAAISKDGYKCFLCLSKNESLVCNGTDSEGNGYCCINYSFEANIPEPKTELINKPIAGTLGNTPSATHLAKLSFNPDDNLAGVSSLELNSESNDVLLMQLDGEGGDGYDVSVSVTSTTANVSWNAIENADSYDVEFGQTTYSTVNTSYSLTSLTAATDYSVSGL